MSGIDKVFLHNRLVDQIASIDEMITMYSERSTLDATDLLATSNLLLARSNALLALTNLEALK